jgi:hypothetical protein
MVLTKVLKVNCLSGKQEIIEQDVILPPEISALNAKSEAQILKEALIKKGIINQSDISD